jgi:hypothetical protein
MTESGPRAISSSHQLQIWLQAFHPLHQDEIKCVIGSLCDQCFYLRRIPVKGLFLSFSVPSSSQQPTISAHPSTDGCVCTDCKPPSRIHCISGAVLAPHQIISSSIHANSQTNRWAGSGGNSDTCRLPGDTPTRCGYIRDSCASPPSPLGPTSRDDQ